MKLHPAPRRAACLVIAALWTCQVAAEPAVRVFVSGTDGYHTYRIPALVISKAGTLLAFCEGRKTDRADHGDVDLLLKRSIDGGRTWGPQQLVHEEGGAAKVTIGNACPVVDSSTGRVWLAFTRENRAVFLTHSDDDGKSWARPTEISSSAMDPAWTWVATGPGNGIQMLQGKHRGRLVLPCDHRVGVHDARNSRGHSHTLYSDDHGKTWQRGKPTDAGMNECAIAERSDGKLMLNMRSYRGKNQRAVALSEDGGATWGAALDAPTLVEPVCQASLIRIAPHQPGDKRLLFSNPASTRRDRLTVRRSDDDGASWSALRVLHEGPAAYSNLAMLVDGTAVCLYECGVKDAYETITLSRFSPDSLKPPPKRE